MKRVKNFIQFFDSKCEIIIYALIYIWLMLNTFILYKEYSIDDPILLIFYGVCAFLLCNNLIKIYSESKFHAENKLQRCGFEKVYECSTIVVYEREVYFLEEDDAKTDTQTLQLNLINGECYIAVTSQNNIDFLTVQHARLLETIAFNKWGK